MAVVNNLSDRVDSITPAIEVFIYKNFCVFFFIPLSGGFKPAGGGATVAAPPLYFLCATSAEADARKLKEE